LYALTFIISPFFQIHRRLLEKELQFGKISVIEVIANLGSGMLGIILALFGFGVYSIIAQTVSLTMFYMVLTRCNIKWKPDYHFTFRETKSLIVFSLKMKGARLANFLARNIDFLILSKLFDITLFGYYSLAYRVMYFPIRRFSNVFSDILFPVFSKIQSNEKKIKTGYLKSIQIVAMAAIPISSILAVLSKPLVSVFLGEKWLQVSDILFVLSVAGLLQSIEVISDSIFPALNSPQTLLIIEILRIIVTGIAVVIGGIFGLLEVALALLAARLLLFVINFGILQRFIHIKFIEVGRKLLGPIFSGLIMFLCLSLLANRETITLPSLILTLTAGILSYFAVLTMCNFGDLKYLYLKLRVKNSV
jgi:PST family polysaccharide transporter